MSSRHLDLDALADVLAGEPAPPHLAGCPQCTAELTELRVADEQVRARLAALPDPPLPADLAARLARAATRQGSASVTTLPARRSPGRWLPAAAAAMLLLGGGAFAVTHRDGEPGGATSAAGDSTAGRAETGLGLVRNDTGRPYDNRGAIAAAVPSLLAGTAASVPQAASAPRALATAATDSAAPLARLHTPAGLAECLLAVLPQDDPSVQPLALDYGSYRGRPALVLLLPSALPRKVDAYVLGAGCSRADAEVLFYTAVDAP